MPIKWVKISCSFWRIFHCKGHVWKIRGLEKKEFEVDWYRIIEKIGSIIEGFYWEIFKKIRNKENVEQLIV